MTPDLINLRRDLSNILESATRTRHMLAIGHLADAGEAADETHQLACETLADLRAITLAETRGTPDDTYFDLTSIHLGGKTRPPADMASGEAGDYGDGLKAPLSSTPGALRLARERRQMDEAARGGRAG